MGNGFVVPIPFLFAWRRVKCDPVHCWGVNWFMAGDRQMLYTRARLESRKDSERR
jgi:hypothetical protein